ncbi:MAG TPA: hypothetical protein VFF39_00715 [Verrucomicrobiae bacterium]|nr:hypothetical protein [Verrucomicrobiae bacterium]
MRIRSRRRSKGQSGMGLAELFVALGVLLIVMTALLQLVLACAYTNNKNSKDTSATLLAQMVLEQVSAQHPDSTATITLTDCANAAHTVATAGGAAPNGLGANVDTNAADMTYGMIDWSQKASAVAANYHMQYTDCAPNGRQTVYDVRWNIITISANETRLITVSARQVSTWNTKSGGGGLSLMLPVTLRGIGGP